MIKRLYNLIINYKIPTLASSIAFNIILNGGSILFLYLIVSNYFGNNYILSIINSLEDSKLKDLVLYFIDYQNNIRYSFFLIITSIYSASSLYYHFVNVIELLIKRSCKINMTRRLISIILTLLFLIGCNMVVILMFKFIRNIGISLDIGFILIMIILVSVVLYLINIIAIKEYSFKKIYKGYLFSLIYTIIFTVGFIIYLRLFSNFKIIYGVLSFIFIFCFYIYSICIGLLVGICINNEKRINNINGM